MIGMVTRCLLLVLFAVASAVMPVVAAAGPGPGPQPSARQPSFQQDDDRREQRQDRRADRRPRAAKDDERRADRRGDRRQGRAKADGRRAKAQERRADRREEAREERRRAQREEERERRRQDVADDDDDRDDDDDDVEADVPIPGGAPYEAPIIDDDGDDSTDGFRSHQAIVRLTPGADIDAYRTRHDAIVGAAIPAQHLYLISLRGGQLVDLGALRNDSRTVWAELNYAHQAPEGRPGRFFLSGIPVSPEAAAATEPPAALNLATAWTCATGVGVVVAVLDTGVDTGHPELAGRIAPGGRNVLTDAPAASDAGNGRDDDGDGLIDEMTGHGTHVAGIIAQTAPDARILPVTVLDSDGVGDAFYLAAGIYHAIERGADVINLSLGSTHDARVIAEAVRAAHDAGIVVVAAAGNADRETPAEYPAIDDYAFGVAATDANDVKSEFSNYHGDLLLSAPGTDIVSAFPGGGYARWSGTSMATPWVAGAAAIVLERAPNLSVEEIAKRFEEAADPIPDRDSRYDGKLGDGRLDVGAAGCGGVAPGDDDDDD